MNQSQLKNFNIQQYLPYFCLGFVAVVFFMLFNPGEMSSDTFCQLEAARLGRYNDHHPAVMSFVWRQLLRLSNGPLPIFVLHCMLLFSAVYHFMRAMPTASLKYSYIAIVMIPTVLQYSFFIWKDVGMTFSYLLIASLLVRYTVNKHPIISSFTQQLASTAEQKPKMNVKIIYKLQLSLIAVLLFYGSAIKFQGKYLSLFLVMWLSYSFFPQTTRFKKLLIGFCGYLILLSSIEVVNNKLVPETQKSHSWQYVKLFDLTGISLKLNQPLYPQFVLQNPNFNFSKIKDDFNFQRIDEIAFDSNAPLRIGKTNQERDALWHQWQKIVVAHPWLYLKYRWISWCHNIIDRPFKSAESLTKSQIIPTSVHACLESKWMVSCINFGLDSLKFIYWLPFVLLYLILGLKYWSRSAAAKPLFFMNLLGLTMMGLLFFLSMAAIPRYIYITIVFLHFSHPLAYLCWRQGAGAKRLA